MHWILLFLNFYVSTCYVSVLAFLFFSIVHVLGASTALGDCSEALIFCAVERMVVYYNGNEISLSIPLNRCQALVYRLCDAIHRRICRHSPDLEQMP